jgi:hypothetical protein
MCRTMSKGGNYNLAIYFNRHHLVAIQVEVYSKPIDRYER